MTKRETLRALLMEDLQRESPIRTRLDPMAMYEPSNCVLNCGSDKACDTTRCPLPDPNDPEHQEVC